MSVNITFESSNTDKRISNPSDLDSPGKEEVEAAAKDRAVGMRSLATFVGSDPHGRTFLTGE